MNKFFQIILAITLGVLLTAGVVQAITVPWERPAVGRIHPIYLSDNVGIGTTTPNVGSYTGRTLTIWDSANPPVFEGIRNIQTASSLAFTMRGGTLSNSALGGFTVYSGSTASKGEVRFQTSDGSSILDRMTINENGNIGIGTTSPYAKLSVVGEVVSSYFTATSTTATSTFANGLELTGGCFKIGGACISAGSGTVTSVDMSVPTGLTISGNPITTSGTLALTYTAGYAGVLTASTTNWNTFYDTPSNRITDGTGLTWSSNTLNCDTASGSVQGCLTSSDWTTFNGKQAGDATLTALAGLTITAGSLITGTGADAFSVLAGGTNGYVLAMSGGAPAWVATTTLSTISGTLDISSQSNLAVTAPITLTGDTLSLGNVTQYPAFTYATSSAWTGTTTIPLAPAYVAETWNGVKCFTNTGTLNVSFYDGTNRMNLLNASTTVGTFTLSSNNSFTASEKRYVDVGTPASSPTKISCTISKTLSIN
ncbi:hypothetical protein C4544_05205 [candidate division WS5 bacterium]|uniref:Uncharacterized protein n=1 Tax=candidate division WS5 bacterium TaxID=2093353 RepID=A0A419DBC4_9BACT|nr:MAG: hypothetical protein C4544_05205 [candidate division WS5 bacterium]